MKHRSVVREGGPFESRTSGQPARLNEGDERLLKRVTEQGKLLDAHARQHWRVFPGVQIAEEKRQLDTMAGAHGRRRWMPVELVGIATATRSDMLIQKLQRRFDEFLMRTQVTEHGER